VIVVGVDTRLFALASVPHVARNPVVPFSTLACVSVAVILVVVAAVGVTVGARSGLDVKYGPLDAYAPRPAALQMAIPMYMLTLLGRVVRNAVPLLKPFIPFEILLSPLFDPIFI
jgi:hypothetical protein